MPPITIYTTPMCPYCIAAKRLLNRNDLPFTEINVALNRGLRAEMREKAGGSNAVPQIWIGELHVGGCDELHVLESSGELDKIVSTEG